MEKKKQDQIHAIKSLLDLPEFRPEIAQVHLPRLNIVLALRALVSLINWPHRLMVALSLLTLA